VALESVVISDGWRGYNGLARVGFNAHLRIEKKQGGETRFVRGRRSLQTASRAFGRSPKGGLRDLT
jgi:hypothetical protein